MIQGVLFDMDGVLVDSESFICKAAVKMYEEMGIKVKPQDFIPFIGAGENRYIGGVAEKYNININIEEKKRRTYEIYYEIIKGNLKSLPGVHEFITKCKEANIKIALATSADKKKMIMNLQEIDLCLDTFDAVINGLDVKRKKPHPDIYLEAAKRINVDIHNCIVVEDAVNGVIAANKSGAKCLALTTSFSAEQLDKADYIVKDLSEIDEDYFNKIIKK